MRTRNRLLLDILEVLAAPYSVLSRVLPQMAAIGVAIVVATYVFMYYQRLDPVSAMYAAVSLVTTIGLYAPSVKSMPVLEKVLLSALMVSSVAVYTTLVVSIVSTLTRRAIWVDARARWRAAHLESHVVVLSDILEIAEELERLGIEYIMVTRNEEVAGLLKGHRVIIGDPSSEQTLRAAGVEAASAVLIALSTDAESLTALIRTRKLNPRARVIVVVNDKRLSDVFLDAGASQVIMLRAFLSRALASMALSANIGGMLLESTESSKRALKQAGYAIGFFTVSQGSACDGMKISDLPKGLVPVMIERDGSFTSYFSTSTTLKVGDGLVVLGDPKKFSELRRLCESETKQG